MNREALEELRLITENTPSERFDMREWLEEKAGVPACETPGCMIGNYILSCDTEEECIKRGRELGFRIAFYHTVIGKRGLGVPHLRRDCVRFGETCRKIGKHFDINPFLAQVLFGIGSSDYWSAPDQKKLALKRLDYILSCKEEPLAEELPEYKHSPNYCQDREEEQCEHQS